MAIIPGNTTIGTIRLTARRETQMEYSPVVVDTEWNQYIQTARKQLYGILIQKFGQNYAQKIYEFLTDGTLNRYPLPTDTFKVSKVDVQMLGYPGGFWGAANRVELSVIQRYDIPNGIASWTNQVYYALFGDYTLNTQSIWLAPQQPNRRPIRIIYVPRLADATDRGMVRLNRVVATDSFTFTATGFGTLTLTAGTDFAVGATDIATAVNLANAINAASSTDLGGGFLASQSGTVVTVAQTDAAADQSTVVTWSQTGDHMTLAPLAGWSNVIDGVNGWEEFCVVQAAMVAMEKQGRPEAAFFGQRRAEMLKLIEDEAANRDAGAPVTGADTLGLDSGAWAGDGFGFGGNFGF